MAASASLVSDEMSSPQNFGESQKFTLRRIAKVRFNIIRLNPNSSLLVLQKGSKKFAWIRPRANFLFVIIFRVLMQEKSGLLYNNIFMLYSVSKETKLFSNARWEDELEKRTYLVMPMREKKIFPKAFICWYGNAFQHTTMFGILSPSGASLPSSSSPEDQNLESSSCKTSPRFLEQTSNVWRRSRFQAMRLWREGQFGGIGGPFYDLAYYLYANTNTAFRSKHEKYLFRDYTITPSSLPMQSQDRCPGLRITGRLMPA